MKRDLTTNGFTTTASSKEPNNGCSRSLTIISRRQLDQKIMRVCISYTHLYSIKSLNNTLPSRICKLCFLANMHVASTLWPSRKSQKISEYRFRLKWTKCSPRTEAKQVKIGQPQRGSNKEAQTSPTPSSWGRLAAVGPTTSTSPRVVSRMLF